MVRLLLSTNGEWAGEELWRCPHIDLQHNIRMEIRFFRMGIGGYSDIGEMQMEWMHRRIPMWYPIA